MPHVCMRCDNDTWECGDESVVCSAGEKPPKKKKKGKSTIRVGGKDIVVTIYERETADGSKVVRMEGKGIGRRRRKKKAKEK